MKKSLLLLIPLPFLPLLWILESPESVIAPPFAVVELFTSEGCSSCPPADELLAKLMDESREEGWQVYALAFHVDYWNRLGWKDEFSSSKYSDRQRKYASTMDGRVYTPQMIVNGRNGFTGSNSNKAHDAIEAALKIPAAATLTIEEILTEGDKLKVRFSNSEVASGSVLHLALVERDLSSQVTKGENSGRTLHHQNVVRNFTTLALPNTVAEIHVPDNVKLSQASVVAFIQNPETMEITAADAKELIP